MSIQSKSHCYMFIRINLTFIYEEDLAKIRKEIVLTTKFLYREVYKLFSSELIIYSCEFLLLEIGVL